MIKKIMKGLAIFFAISLTLIIFDLFNDYRQDRLTLVYEFKPGEKFKAHKQSQHFFEITEGALAGWAELQKNDYRIEFTVNSVAPDGTATIKAQIKDYRIENNDRSGGYVVLGTGQQDDISALVNNAMSAPFLLEVSPRGELRAILNFNDIEEAYLIGADQKMFESVEATTALQNIFNLYIGTAETARDNIFGGYFPVWPDHTVLPSNSWTHTARIDTQNFQADQTTTYTYDSNSDDKYRINMLFSTRMEDVTTTDPSISVELAQQDSNGFIEYRRGEILPDLQLHRYEYQMSQFVTYGGERQLVSKADVKSQTRVSYGDQLANDEAENWKDPAIAEIQNALEAHRLSDEVSQSVQESLEAMPSPEQINQKTQQMLRYIESVQDSIEQEKQTQTGAE